MRGSLGLARDPHATDVRRLACQIADTPVVLTGPSTLDYPPPRRADWARHQHKESSRRCRSPSAPRPRSCRGRSRLSAPPTAGDLCPSRP